MKIKVLPQAYEQLGIELNDPQAALGRNFPDFMLVGPQRTGTTFLSLIMRRHPNLMITRPKEPFYFANLVEPPHYKEVTRDFEWYLDLFDISLETRAKLVKSRILTGRIFGKLIRGEATAQHAAQLTPEIIDFILRINPDMKIVIGVRNPIERAWSHLKKDLFRDRVDKTTVVTTDEMIGFLKKPYILSCGDYPTIIEKWRAQIDPCNLHLFEFRKLAEDPKACLDNLCAFLGIGSGGPLWRDFYRSRGKVNSTEEMQIPIEVKEFLRDNFSEVIHRMDQEFQILL